jgi:hypothetical protein
MVLCLNNSIRNTMNAMPWTTFIDQPKHHTGCELYVAVAYLAELLCMSSAQGPKQGHMGEALTQHTGVGEFRKTRHPRNVEFNKVLEACFSGAGSSRFPEAWNL